MQQEHTSQSKRKENIIKEVKRMRYEKPIASIYALNADVIATSTTSGKVENTTEEEEV